MASETVALSPSDSSRKFNVHKGILQQKCRAVYTACTSFKEGKDGVYKFETVSEGTLIRFIHWAYTSDYPEEVESSSPRESLADAKTDSTSTQAVTDADENHPLLLHGRLYVFAEVYLAKDLKALALKRLRAKLRSWEQPRDLTRLTSEIELFDLAFSNLHPDDELLDFLGKYAAKNIADLKQQQYFNDVVGKMGPAIVRYLQPWSGDPFKKSNGTYD